MKLPDEHFLSLSEAASRFGCDISKLINLGIENKIRIYSYVDLYNFKGLTGRKETCSNHIQITPSHLNSIAKNGSVEFVPDYHFSGMIKADDITVLVEIADLKMVIDDINKIENDQVHNQHKRDNKGTNLNPKEMGSLGGKAKAERMNATYAPAVEVAVREWKQGDGRQHNKMADWLIKEYKDRNGEHPFSNLSKSHLLKLLAAELMELRMTKKIRGYKPKK